MRKLTRVTVTAAGICIVMGLGLSLAGRLMGGEPGFWIGRGGLYTNQDVRENRSRARLEVLEKTELEAFQDMEVRVDYNDIVIESSADGRYYIEYRLYTESRDPEYSVKNGILTVTCVRDLQENQNWGQIGFFTINNGTYREAGKVTIYVPEEASFGTVKLSTNDGSIVYGGPQADTLVAISNYGTIEIQDGEAESVSLTASDGSIILDGGTYTDIQVVNKYGKTKLKEISAGTIDVQAADSQITMKEIQANSIFLENKYGGIECSQITADSIRVKQSDGSCRLQEADIKNGTFENRYGSTELELVGKEKEYNYDLAMKYGSVKLNDRTFKEESVTEDNGADRNLSVTANDGKLRITTE